MEATGNNAKDNALKARLWDIHKLRLRRAINKCGADSSAREFLTMFLSSMEKDEAKLFRSKK